VLIRKSKVIGLALNLVQMCNACVYCWNRSQRERSGLPTDELGLDTNVAELVTQLEHDQLPKPEPSERCQFYESHGHDILLGAKAEFLHPAARSVARRVISLLEVYPMVSSRCRLLTKQSVVPFLGKIPNDVWIGTTITTLNDDIASTVEPGAVKVSQRRLNLHLAHDLGFKTWLVVEPFFKDMQLDQLIAMIPFVEEIWVGRLNSSRNIVTTEGRMSGFTCGELAETDEGIASRFSEMMWAIQDNATGPHKPRVYLKREMFRYIEREHPTLIDLLDKHVVESARAGGRA